MKIVGNKSDLFFLLYIQQIVLSQHKEDIISFLLAKGMNQRKVKGLIFLLESISFEENEREYSMLRLEKEEDKPYGNELSYPIIDFSTTPINVNNWFVDK